MGTDGHDGVFYYNSRTQVSTFTPPVNKWVVSQDDQHYWHSHYAQNWVEESDKEILELMPKVASGPNGLADCKKIINSIRRERFEVMFDLRAQGTAKDVFRVTRGGRSYVAKVSIGKANVNLHKGEIKHQKKYPIQEYVVQCTKVLNVKNCSGPVHVEFQEEGEPMDQKYRDASYDTRDDLHEMMKELRMNIRKKKCDVSDFNYANVAMFDGDKLLIHDLGLVVEGVLQNETPRPA